MKRKNKNGKKQRNYQHRSKIGKSIVLNRPTIATSSHEKDSEEAGLGAVILEKSAFDQVRPKAPQPPDEIIYVSWWKAHFLVVNGSRRSLVLLGMILIFLLLVLVIVALLWHQ